MIASSSPQQKELIYSRTTLQHMLQISHLSCLLAPAVATTYSLLLFRQLSYLAVALPLNEFIEIADAITPLLSAH